MNERTTRLRVLHVVSRNQRRGAEASAVELAQRLRGAGYVAEIVALAQARGGPGLPVDVLGQSTLGPSTLKRLRQRIASADVVIAHGSRTLPAVLLASAGMDRRLIYQNIGDPAYWAATPTRRWRVRVQLARMSAVAALTEQAMVALREDFGVAEQRLSVIRNWRDAVHFRPPTPDERDIARSQLAVEDARAVACVVGALSEEKDVSLAVTAALGVPGLTLLVAGDGPDRGRVEAVARAHGATRVVFLGAVSDVRPILHASDVLVLTSLSEGVPGVVIEAGLCGLPVVTTCVGFVTDVVVHGETGIVVPDRDPKSIAAALSTAIGNRDELGARARARCQARFDSAVVTEQWCDLIERVSRSR